MAQPSQPTPTVIATVAGNRQRVNVRDYLNQRVAPFLKKAIHEGLDADAEFPLQWLGEHLIQQSILYEGNPDRTKIRERFVYEHDVTPSNEASTSQMQTATMEDATVVTSSPQLTEQPGAVVEQSALTVTSIPHGSAASSAAAEPTPGAANVQQVNGTTMNSSADQTNVADTEMGGTS